MTLLQWAKRNKRKCPKHDQIPSSLVKTTAWCEICDRIWRLRRNTWSWKYHWYYITDDGNFLAKGGIGK